jgi:lysophospholipase L1-like esterase
MLNQERFSLELNKPFKFITNSLGWRDSVINHHVQYQSEKRRIVVLGDSFVEGEVYRNEETMSGVLEAGLKKAHKNIQVLNGGTASFSPLLEYLRLKDFIDRGFKTDVVLVLVDYSDVVDEVQYHKNFVMNAEGSGGFQNFWHRSSLLRLALNQSAFIRQSGKLFRGIVYPKILRLRDKLVGSESESENTELEFHKNPLSKSENTKLEFHKNPLEENPRHQGYDLIERNIKRISNLCKSEDIKLIFGLYPWPFHLYKYAGAEFQSDDYFKSFNQIYKANKIDLVERGSQSIYERKMVKILNKYSVPFINLFPRLRGHKDWYKYYLKGDIHFNQRGHRFVGQELARELLLLKYL